MPTYNVITELETCTSFAEGKSGRRYTLEQLDAAEAAAAAGDPAAAALVRDADYGIDAQGQRLSPAQILEHIVHDCPDCQAARARGEVPVRWSPGDVLERLGDEWRVLPPATNSHARRRRRERLRRLRRDGQGPIGN